MENAEEPGPSKVNVGPEYAVDNYDAIQHQQEEIEKEIKESGPLVGEPTSLSTLEDDFRGHSVYLAKLEELKKRYSKVRRLRRDGNCFYRAFGFAYIEYLMLGKRKEEAEKFIQRCGECKNNLIEMNYPSFTVEDFHDVFTGMVEKMVLQDSSVSELEDDFNVQGNSDYYVVFLRLFVSSYIQKNPEFYSSFIENKTVKQFCQTEVEPMGLESDNVHVAVLAQATDVGIAVENCQSSGALTRLEFPGREDTAAAGERVPAPVTLLYRPGHYDVLYA